MHLRHVDSRRFTYPLHNPDETWDGCVLVTPLGVGVEVHPLLLEYQLRGEEETRMNVKRRFNIRLSQIPRLLLRTGRRQKSPKNLLLDKHLNFETSYQPKKHNTRAHSKPSVLFISL